MPEATYTDLAVSWPRYIYFPGSSAADVIAVRSDSVLSVLGQKGSGRSTLTLSSGQAIYVAMEAATVIETIEREQGEDEA